WRSTSDPWAILVSEVMSQQTQISRVVPAWTAFMSRYPTPGDLARSDRAELIVRWAGLGYQRRAINLQRAATIVDEQGWPTTVEGLQRLPGVGPYTAAAVACFAFGVPTPAIDTNLKRILSRWHGEPLGPTALRRAAEDELPHGAAADWLQALMDLGADVCRPRDPQCGVCPVTDWCADPTVYEPPPRQSRYEGSVRQARAAILKALASDGPATEPELASAIGLERSTVANAAHALERESVVVRDGAKLALATD
ncbi:MAG TPA: helix-turn-helix domain-containing protein, partial [Acidimicrobiia bacterium]